MPEVKLIPIKPKFAKLIDDAKLGKEIRDALDHTANLIRDDFNKTVQTWDDKPSFTKDVRFQEAAVYTEHEIYYYVTRGTRPHLIRPRTAKLLRFRTGYSAKTRPRVISSRKGGPSGPFVTARQVQHPGTEAREFDKEIATRRQKNLVNLLKLAFNRSIRSGGA